MVNFRELSARIQVRHLEIKSGCGANAAGGGGFVAGNTCARGGGATYTDNQVKSLDNYVSDYERIQAEAKKSGKVSPYSDVKNLDDAIDASDALSEGTVVWRGIEVVQGSPEQKRLLDNLKKGNSFSYGGFSSVSTRKDVAERFAIGGGALEGTNILVKITLSQATKAAHVKGSDLDEYILPRSARGGSFKVDKVSRKGNNINVEARYIRPA